MGLLQPPAKIRSTAWLRPSVPIRSNAPGPEEDPGHRLASAGGHDRQEN